MGFKVKKIILFFILNMTVVLAQASKARIQSLANSFHLIDVQSVYRRPLDLIYLDDLISLESGLTTPTTLNNNAEVLLSTTYQNNRHVAVALGHQDSSVIDTRSFINAVSGTNFELAQNPVNIFYAVDDSVNSYAVGLFYSAKNDKLANLNESSAGVSLGVELGRFQLNAVYVPINFSEILVGKKFTASGAWLGSVSYLLDQTLFEFSYATSEARLSTELGGLVRQDEAHTKDEVTLGLVDSYARDENNFFWGTQVITTRLNCSLNLSTTCDKIFTYTVLPAWFGIEVEASEELIFRGVVKQSFLVSIAKDEFGYPVSVPGATDAVSNIPAGANNTVISAGLGFKFKNIIIDGNLSTASTQTLNSNDFLSQVSLTFR